MPIVEWTKEELDLLKLNSTVIAIPPNQVLFCEGSSAKYIYYIQSGYLKHYHNTDNGKEVIVSVCKKGEIIGLPAVLLGKTRGVFAKTMEESIFWQISKESFLDIISTNANMAVKIITLYCSYVRCYEYRLEELLTASTEDKLSALICNLAVPVTNADNKKCCCINCRLTHQEMANMIGACRQTVTKILGEFRKEGWIKIKPNNTLEIINCEKISRHAKMKKLEKGCIWNE